jgi:hypothetical protein
MAPNDALRQIADLVEHLSEEELARVMEFLNAEYRHRLRRAAQRAALTLREGDRVETLQPGRRVPRGARGRVLHVARSRVHVDFGELGIWALLPTGVRKVESERGAALPPPPPEGR